MAASGHPPGDPGRINRMEWKGCPNPVGYIILQNGTKKPIACMSWTCPHCGPLKKLRLARRISRGFFGQDNIIAITLTQKLGSRRNILKDFETVRWKLKKEHHILLTKYFWVKEFTKRGQRHLHILCNSKIDKDLLKKIWKEVTLGESYRTWINEKPISNSAGYLFKYLCKAYDMESRYKHKERRYGFSKDTGFAPEKGLIIYGDFWYNIAHPEHIYIDYQALFDRDKKGFKPLSPGFNLTIKGVTYSHPGQSEKFISDLQNNTNESKVMNLGI